MSSSSLFSLLMCVLAFGSVVFAGYAPRGRPATLSFPAALPGPQQSLDMAALPPRPWSRWLEAAVAIAGTPAGPPRVSPAAPPCPEHPGPPVRLSTPLQQALCEDG